MGFAMLTDPNMEFFLRSIDLNPSDARQLFVLLDADGSGEIDTEELLVGLTRLQGGAKAMDLAHLMYQFTTQAHIWENYFARLENKLSAIALSSHMMTKRDSPQRAL